MKHPTVKRVVLTAGVAGVAALLGGWVLWGGRPPQLGREEEVFQTVDALFTAVTAREKKLLRDCEQQLQGLKSAGKMPGEASVYLDGVFKQARAGRWESAAERLYGFMKAQRREGTQHQASRKKEGHRPEASQNLGGITSKRVSR
jgi:hypothetical protein